MSRILFSLKGVILLKKSVKLILFAYLCAVVLSSSGCGGADEPCADFVARAITSVPGFAGSYVIYRSDALPSDPEYMDRSPFAALYYRDKPDAGEPTLLDDWCVALAASENVRELHVLHVRSRSDRIAVERMVEARARILRSPELFAAQSDFWGSRPADVRVITHGNFVILAAGNDCSGIEDMF